jgi:carbonic anhydrase/acetyltransferase-like protein (isoleucine patch superfamily)
MSSRSNEQAGTPSFVHPSACVYGNVILNDGASLWPNAVIRAESDFVQIGRFTNIQDFAMIHIGIGFPVVVGDYCSITHHATLHGCTIEDFCLIGINTTVMDGCRIGRGSVVAGHSFLREGTVVPPASIVMGTPAKVTRMRDSSLSNVINALLYHRNATEYARGNYRAWDGVAQCDWEAKAEEIISSAANRSMPGLSS